MLFSRSEFGTRGIEAVNLKATCSYHSQNWSIWMLESLQKSFSLKQPKFVIPTSHKYTRELIATDPCLRQSKYWGSWSCHSKSKQNISIKYSSIPTLEFLKHVCKKSLKSVLWFVIDLTYAEKKSVDGFLKRFICVLAKIWNVHKTVFVW